MTKICPECKGNIFHHDNIHAEIICRQCGLVIQAPYVEGLIFPGFMHPRRYHKVIVNIRLTFHSLKNNHRFHIIYDLKD